MEVYISYSAADCAPAARLASHLATAGVRSFLSERVPSLGTNLALEIGKALKRCQAMVVLVSPDYARSERTRLELGFALGSATYQDRVIPLLLRPTADIPWILEKLPMVQVGDDWNAAARQVVEALTRAQIHSSPNGEADAPQASR